ncbi:MAG: alpha/beta fold hydrolase [Deltaproteobacteria bacterium]|nr:alpha/beta fold hydrolase [Deltaproteobacteria bacterium]
MEPWHHLPTPLGYQVPVWWQPAEVPARGAVLVVPALGTPAAVYRRFAGELARAGYAALVLELRGYGQSKLRAGRRRDWGYAEMVTQDLPAALLWLRDQAPGLPLVLAGHSLGGHLALAYAALRPAAAAGVLLLACASPYVGYYTGAMGRRLRLGLQVMPSLISLLGYFPGNRVGFGGREAAGVMRDWLRLAREDRFAPAGLPVDLETRLAAYAGPVLSVSFRDDLLAPPAAVGSINRRLTSARLAKLELGATELGCRAGHFNWTREPAGLTAQLMPWLTGLGKA